MKQIFSLAYKFSQRLDIFHFPINLFLNKSEKTHSLTGKLISLFLLIFFIYSFINSDFIKKKNPITLQQDLKMSLSPDIFLSKDNFTVAIGLANGNRSFVVDPTIFFLTLVTHQRNYSDLTLTYKNFSLNLCEMEEFPDSVDFLKFGFNKAYCLPDETLRLSDLWQGDSTNNFWFELHKCSNNSINNNSCKSNEEILDTLSKLYLNVYFTYNNIDFSKLEDPISKELSFFDNKINVKLQKTINVQLKSILLLTDDGFYYENTNKIMSFQQNEVKYDTTGVLNEDEEVLFYVIFNNSDIQQLITRKYQKLQDFLAQITAFIHIIIFIGYYLGKLENKLNMVNLIGNELFIYQKLVKSTKKQETKTQSNNLDSVFLRKLKKKKGKNLTVNNKPKHFDLSPIILKTNDKEQKEVKNQHINKSNIDLENQSIMLPSNYSSRIENSSNKINLEDNKTVSISELEFFNKENINHPPKPKLVLNPPEPKNLEDDEPFPEKEEIILPEIRVSMQKFCSEKEIPLKKDLEKINLELLDCIDLKNSKERLPKYKRSSNLHINCKKKLPLQTESAKLRISSNQKSSSWKEKIKKFFQKNFENKLMDLFSPFKGNDSVLMNTLDYYQKIKKKENFFSLSKFGFIKLLFKNKSWKLNNKEKLFLKGEEQILKEMDLLQILKKLQDIEKLKKILLNDDQLYFFNLLSKPLIKLQEPYKEKHRMSDNLKNVLEKEKLVEIYKGLKSKANLSEIDKRIIHLLDEDVKSFIKNEEYSI